MKNIRFFLSEIFHFLMAKFSIYLNRRVFVMLRANKKWADLYHFHLQKGQESSSECIIDLVGGLNSRLLLAISSLLCSSKNSETLMDSGDTG